MKQLELPLINRMARPKHIYKSDRLGGGHNGEYYYNCIHCGLTDWIASYGTEDQLKQGPCAPGWPPGSSHG